MENLQELKQQIEVLTSENEQKYIDLIVAYDKIHELSITINHLEKMLLKKAIIIAEIEDKIKE